MRNCSFLFGHHRDKLGAGYTSVNASIDLVSRDLRPFLIMQ